MMQQFPLVSIILVNYNGADVLYNCLNSIEKFLPKSECEIILVDNNSTDGSLESVEQRFSDIRFIKLSENRGFGTGNNVGAKVAQGKFLFLLNTDTILTSNVLPHLIDLMDKRPEVGIIGSKLLNTDGSFQISFAFTIGIKGEYRTQKMHKAAENNFQLKLLEEEYKDIKEVDIVVGAAFFIRTSLFNTIGGFDERFFMYLEESDLCQRIQNQGYKIIYTPHVSLIHIKGHTSKKSINAMTVEYRRSQLYYYQKHRPIWEQLLLKVYLLYKFLYKFMTTGNHYYLKILKLLISDQALRRR